MLERYTEKARRAIFFARYEASQFGSEFVEAEHLLLGLLREDKALAERLLPEGHDAAESIRQQLEAQTPPRRKVSTSVDLPLSDESKRVLAYGAEESERLRHLHIGTEHLVLGTLREPQSLAAKLLLDRGVRLERTRALAAESSPKGVEDPAGVPPWPAGPPTLLLELLADREKAGDITVATNDTVAGIRAYLAIYKGKDVLHAGDPLIATENPALDSPVGEATALRRKVRFAVVRMENAIANQDFEKARFHSDEERRAREQLEVFREREAGAGQEGSRADPVPIVCILLPGNESLARLRNRTEILLQAGVAHVWLWELAGKRAYTADRREGLRESMGDTLLCEEPRIEINWRRLVR